MGVACIDGMMWTSYYITEIFFKIPVPANVIFWISIVGIITYPTIMGLLIRFERVQVQLKAHEENTIKIFESI